MIEELRPYTEYKASGNATPAAPQGRRHTSPGQRPGFHAKHTVQALKGRPIRRMKPCPSLRAIWTALAGLESFVAVYPGRCPGLGWHCPVGAQKGGQS